MGNDLEEAVERRQGDQSEQASLRPLRNGEREGDRQTDAAEHRSGARQRRQQQDGVGADNERNLPDQGFGPKGTPFPYLSWHSPTMAESPNRAKLSG